MSRKSRHVRRVARALGASRTVPLGRVDHTPVGFVALTERVRRLRSTGPGGTGRPSNPLATIPRIVKFKSSIWKRLDQVARQQARITGRRVSPAQVASMVIEEALGETPRRLRRAK